jgi:hypothetical protein
MPAGFGFVPRGPRFRGRVRIVARLETYAGVGDVDALVFQDCAGYAELHPDFERVFVAYHAKVEKVIAFYKSVFLAEFG